MESIDTIMSSSVSYGPIEMASGLNPGISMNILPNNTMPNNLYFIIGVVVVVAAGFYIINKINEVNAAQYIKEELKRT